MVTTEERWMPLVGRKVESIDTGAKSDSIRLSFAGGGSETILLDGDCCSLSYFTADALEDVKSLVGRTIVAVEDRGDAHSAARQYPSADDYNKVSWHFLVITTDKGHVTLDWRNDSNGYYDGTAFLEGGARC